MAGRKRSSAFAITLNHVEWDKTCFGEFMLAGDLVRRICVAEEKHHPPLDPLSGELLDNCVSKHHHVFVEFVEKYFLPEVREMVVQFLCEEEHSFDIQVSAVQLLLFE